MLDINRGNGLQGIWDLAVLSLKIFYKSKSQLKCIYDHLQI